MAFSATSYLAPQFQSYKFYWIKFYEPGTTSPKSIATDSTGGTLIAKAEIDNKGFFETAGGAVFIPFIDGFYDAYLFPTEAAADANDTSSAVRIADNIWADDGSFGFNDVVDMVTKPLAANDRVTLPRYYAGGALVADLDYLIKTAAQAIADSDIVDEAVNHALVNTNVAVLIHDGTLNPEQAGADGTSINDTAAFAALAAQANILKLKHLVSDENYLLSAGYTITAPSFKHSGGGFIKTDPTLIAAPGDGVQLAEYSGANVSITGVLFDGQSDNTASGDVTPTFKLVVLSGKNPHWDARTQNSGGYALDVTGKNPYIERHLDSNSMYDMVRFFPQEEWDYCRVGIVSGDRVSSVAAASGRGVIFNGVNVINSITIDQFKSTSRGILADAAAGGATGVGYYKNMHIKSLVQYQAINSGAASTEGTKLENVENLTIDYCEITHDSAVITDFVALKLTDTLGCVKIGTLKTTGRNSLPTGIPVNVELFMYSGAVINNEVIYAADDDDPTYWNFDHIFFDTTTVAASSKAVINHNALGGNITIQQYTEVNQAFALMKCSIVQRNLYTVNAIGFTEFVSSSFEESVTQIPRQVISSNFANMTGQFNRGDIAWRQNQATGSTAMQVCTTAGTANGTAVLTDALTL